MARKVHGSRNYKAAFYDRLCQKPLARLKKGTRKNNDNNNNNNNIQSISVY